MKFAKQILSLLNFYILYFNIDHSFSKFHHFCLPLGVVCVSILQIQWIAKNVFVLSLYSKRRIWTQKEERRLKWNALESHSKSDKKQEKKNQKNAEVKFVFAKRPASTAKHLGLWISQSVRWNLKTGHISCLGHGHLFLTKQDLFATGFKTCGTGVDFINCFCPLRPCAQLLRQKKASQKVGRRCSKLQYQETICCGSKN